MRLILMGPPGSGKGTLASDLVKQYDVPHISTGDIFRKHIAEKTQLGVAVTNYIQRGALVPDNLTIDMVKDRLEQPDCAKGFLLDGFPRTIPQAEALDGLPVIKQNALTAVLNLVVRDETILKRLSGRRHCSVCGQGYNLVYMPPRREGICDRCGGEIKQRPDDQEETVKERLMVYKKQTEPLIDYYKAKGLLLDLDNEGTIQDCFAQALQKLAERNSEVER